MDLEIYILDLIGTFAFAVYGSYFALEKNCDIFGVFTAAFLTAVGGGTLREILSNNVPFYFFDKNYLISIILGVLFAIVFFKRFHKVNKFVLFLDSIGLVAFALIGASKANAMDLGFFGIIFFATITAVGGGLLRDVLLNKVPELMHRDFYASVAILLGLSYGLFVKQADNLIFINGMLLFFLILRLLAASKKVNLWKPVNSQIEETQELSSI